jgi:hypothetical protein
LKRFVFISLSLLLLILVPGCVTFQTAPPAGQPSVIGAFSSNPSAINPGGTSILLWNVTGANSVSIDQGNGQVAVAGTMVVSPAASTVYTISATNSAGTVTRSAVTTVNSPPAPIIPVSITAVTGVTVGIDQYPFTGPCPKTINFWGTIAANGPCIVTYRWERSDGVVIAPETIIFIADGSKTVTNQWTRGEGSGWQRLHVLTPNDTVSRQIDFQMTCWELSQ